MPNSANIVFGKPDKVTGGVSVAPYGTPIPVDAFTALDAAFKTPGYIGESGLTESSSFETEPIGAWGGDDVAMTPPKERSTFTFDVIEAFSGSALKAVYGDSAVTTVLADEDSGDLHTIELGDRAIEYKVWVFDVLHGGKRIRIVVPKGAVTAVGDVTYTDSGVVTFPVTVTAMKDDVTGKTVIKYHQSA